LIFEVSNPAPGTFALRGELDMSTAPILSNAVIPIIGERDVLFDLTGLSFMDGAGLRALVQLADHLEGGSLVLESPQPIVRKVLEITRIVGQRNIRFVEPAGIVSRAAG
jgi:anti-anti-sigma factor